MSGKHSIPCFLSEAKPESTPTTDWTESVYGMNTLLTWPAFFLLFPVNSSLVVISMFFFLFHPKYLAYHARHYYPSRKVKKSTEGRRPENKWSKENNNKQQCMQRKIRNKQNKGDRADESLVRDSKFTEKTVFIDNTSEVGSTCFVYSSRFHYFLLHLTSQRNREKVSHLFTLIPFLFSFLFPPTSSFYCVASCPLFILSSLGLVSCCCFSGSFVPVPSRLSFSSSYSCLSRKLWRRRAFVSFVVSLLSRPFNVPSSSSFQNNRLFTCTCIPE